MDFKARVRLVMNTHTCIHTRVHTHMHVHTYTHVQNMPVDGLLDLSAYETVVQAAPAGSLTGLCVCVCVCVEVTACGRSASLCEVHEINRVTTWRLWECGLCHDNMS